MKNLDNRFSYAPVALDMKRSTMKRPFNHKTSFDCGSLVPFFWDSVLPGDTRKLNTSFVIRTSSPLVAPIMDNLYADVYWFFVPNRLVWDHWREFMGENTDSAWVSEVKYSIPQVKYDFSLSNQFTGWETGTIADYMGIPTGKALSVSALPFRAYGLIVDQWFRDQNLQDPVLIDKGDNDIVGSNGSDYVQDLVKGGKPFVVNKFHDYFSSSMPAPQKGESVPIPLGDITFGSTSVPVLPGSEDLFYDGQVYSGDPIRLVGLSHESGKIRTTFNAHNLCTSHATSTSPGTLQTSNGSVTPLEDNVFFNNLYANLGDISASISTDANINTLRMCFQLQKMLERDSRSGSRYTEVLAAHFGVRSPDSRLQRPEYLGGSRVPLNINQVVQVSSDQLAPIGNVAAYSVTSSSHNDFTQSFTEHGIIMGLMCVRYHHSYQNGLNREWTKKTKYDIYWPLLANIGETGIRNDEIFAQSAIEDPDNVGEYIDNPENSEIFGYQEAWSEYRYHPSIISGELNSTYQTPLDQWHLGDDYDTLPSLSASWISEEKLNLDRCLSVTSEVSNQFICDFYVEDIATRVMPLYSIPGLIDHH